MAFKEISIDTLKINPFHKISKEWMLITAGDEKKSNTMTASWGGVGIMWGKNVATAYIRPQRYTKEFVDNSEYFTLSFLPEEKREALNVCGRVSEMWKISGQKPDFIHIMWMEQQQLRKQIWYLCAESFMRRICCQNVSQMKNVIQDGIRRKIITPCIWQRS